ncbi:MAG: S8 family peptidase [Elusimicrobia bacterium]|nr:S8 family peptidase [Elusimicrobiota bacterium]
MCRLFLVFVSCLQLVSFVYASNRKIVVFSPDTSWSTRRTAVQNVGGRVIHELNLIHAVAAIFSEDKVKLAVKQLESQQGTVVRVDEDLIYHAIDDIPNPDPQGQQNPWGIDRVKAPLAWSQSRGAGVKVGIVDTGIDPEHPDLKGNVAGGFNATSTETWKWLDDHGHGTHVGGTVAALDNQIGVVGVAPLAQLYGVKVLDANGSGYWSDIAKGIEWCVQNNIRVINMSLGGRSGNESVRQTIVAAYEAGITIVASAGNSGSSVGFPAAYEQTLAISASNSKDEIATFSSRGPEVDFIAPGVKVLSTTGGAYASWSGTSMSAPHMTGLVALKLAQNGSLDPKGVRQALEAAAEPLPNLTSNEQGAGLINAAKLVGATSPTPSLHLNLKPMNPKWESELKALGFELQ